jgi:acyl dehydratase
MDHVAAFTSPVITRVDVAWTCLATNDPSPLHLDERFAVEKAGHPSIVVPGTMLLGWVGEYLEAWAGGPEKISKWTIRFSAPVWPGEAIRLEGRPTGEAKGELTARTTEGREVARVTVEFKPS